MSTPSVAEFFDALNADYSSTIQRCFPRYREMLCSLVDYLPSQAPIGSILEIGCGTGNLSTLIAQKFPQAELHLLDLSGESLQVCRQRLADRQRTQFHHQDARQSVFSEGAFDLIVSSIAIHHLTSAEKKMLFLKSHYWLSAGGTLAFADQCRGATQEIYARHIENWRQLSLDAGSTPAEFEMWMEHQREHDHHDTLIEQVQWLHSAGFSVTDCVWRYLLWSVIVAFK